MTDRAGHDTVDCRSLLWALDRLALYYETGENGDPHVRGETLYSAKVTLDQLVWEVSNAAE